METAAITPYLAFDDCAGACPFTGNNLGSAARAPADGQRVDVDRSDD